MLEVEIYNSAIEQMCQDATKAFNNYSDKIDKLIRFNYDCSNIDGVFKIKAEIILNDKTLLMQELVSKENSDGVRLVVLKRILSDIFLYGISNLVNSQK